MANYHPSDELLMEFTAGQKQDALGIMVACHLESCRECRKRSQVFEQLGGEILGDFDNHGAVRVLRAGERGVGGE